MKEELKTGWLSPSGDFWECPCYEHICTAVEIVSKFNYMQIGKSADDILYCNGWAHIGISTFGPNEWRISWKNFLTDYQKNFLKPYFEDYYPVNSISLYRWKTENGLHEYDKDGFII